MPEDLNTRYLTIKWLSFIFFILVCSFHLKVRATHLIIPMDEVQKNHLKSYGIAFYALEKKLEVDWLLIYRGVSFAL